MASLFLIVANFVDVLQFQLDECPEDFYRDILSEGNFTSVMLKVCKCAVF